MPGPGHRHVPQRAVHGVDLIGAVCARVLDGAWKGLDEVEYATLEWVDWFNQHRLLEPIGYIPPAELEATYWTKETPASIDQLKQPSLQ
jgi:transposase InsO family protein